VGFHEAAPKGGEEEMTEAFGVAGVEVFLGEIEAEIAVEMGEALDQFAPAQRADFKYKGFISLRAAHQTPGKPN
jgi:hypothetical protein